MISNTKESKFTVKDITLIAILTTILFVQEQLLSFLPNVQLTVFLLVVYSKKLGLLKTVIITLIHTILDCLVMGSLNVAYFPFMLIGWMLIPVLLNTIFKKVESNISLAFLGVLFSFMYCWIYIIPSIIILEVDFISYFYADIIWEIILATSSFLTIMLLYTPCALVLDKITKREIY